MEKALWIWENSAPQADEYAEFYTEFSASGEKTVINISADSNYAVYVNGEFIYSGQYPDSPDYKIYDQIDITEYCVTGKNHLGIIVWYYGKANLSYKVGKAGLKFCVCDDTGAIARSSITTRSRLSKAFKSHIKKEITFQLGFGFCYDAKLQDNWLMGEAEDFHDSVVSENTSEVSIRPCKMAKINDNYSAALVKKIRKCRYIYDFGYEVSGLVGFTLNTLNEQKIIVCYGEHLADGEVRRIIDSRDFSFEYLAKKGENVFFSPMRRFGCRYIEFRCEEPVEISKVTVRERLYPATEKQIPEYLSPLRKKIYETCVHTLKRCMSDHYEDCPWREQGLYVMDSRNQMLSGYYAFEGFNFARSNLLLISKDNREDGLLSMTFPSAETGLTIPSFSLHFFTAIAEYIEYSKDTELGKLVYPKMKALLDVFVQKIDNGLLTNFTEGCHWNFYEWIEELKGGDNSPERIDLINNCLLIIAIENFNKIAEKCGIPKAYEEMPQIIRAKINETFYDKKSGFYKNSNREKSFSELGNAFAVLCKVANQETACRIAKELKKKFGKLKKCTLSMACFKYDALLSVSNDNIDYIISDIDSKYEYMIKKGATAFWETMKGQKDFDKAGSLCHGWSAIPIYYYALADKLGKNLKETN